MKNIKDYLHLYLGCECKSVFVGDRQIFCGITKVTAPEGHLIDSAIIQFSINGNRDTKPCSINSVKPILRPLESMTSEEKSYCNFADVAHAPLYINEEVFSFEQMRYMLSKHLDIFDLIGAGLAVDKTKMMPKEPTKQPSVATKLPKERNDDKQKDKTQQQKFDELKKKGFGIL